MTPTDRQDTISWATAELRMVDHILTAHQQRHASAVCTCARPWPCSIRERWAAYGAYVRARLALAEATMLLPVIQAPRVNGPLPQGSARVEGGVEERTPSPRRLRPRWLSRLGR